MYKLSSIFIFIVLFLASCKKETTSSSFTTYPDLAINDTSWTDSAINKPLIDSTIANFGRTYFQDSAYANQNTDVFFNNRNYEFLLAKNTCVDSNNNPITGKFKIQFLPLNSKGDFIRQNLSSGDSTIFYITKKLYNIRLSQNGKQIYLAKLKSYTLRIRDTDTSHPSTNLPSILYFSPSSSSHWQLDITSQAAIWREDDGHGPKAVGYEVGPKKFGWTNLSNSFLFTSNPLKLNITLPVNFTNKNTMVFAVFKNSNIVVRLNSNRQNKLFYTKIPSNSTVILVTLSKIDNKFYWSSSQVLANQNNDIFMLAPKEVTKQQISNNLDNI